ncbi:hypothetical protein MYU51_019071 [Penicillium brevicompactum]|uniref:uncharacterized protein n=1 Tax=Penicillium brevicompactum TaxID=5074 RepID=UPI002540B441|nr:uncharacterized protein N7506_006296 [Penicillium brevicompactum]KAJ5332513.1 hypothetical protein N7506_006296 [Penicillium brevicompactum]
MSLLTVNAESLIHRFFDNLHTTEEISSLDNLFDHKSMATLNRLDFRGVSDITSALQIFTTEESKWQIDRFMHIPNHLCILTTVMGRSQFHATSGGTPFNAGFFLEPVHRHSDRLMIRELLLMYDSRIDIGYYGYDPALQRRE